MLSLDYPAGGHPASTPVDVMCDGSAAGILPARAGRTYRDGEASARSAWLRLVRSPRPRPGARARSAGMRLGAAKHNPISQRTFQTRIAAATGGSTGPSPARDPV